MYKIEIAEPENKYIFLSEYKYFFYFEMGFLILIINYIFMLVADLDKNKLYLMDFIFFFSCILSFSLMFLPFLVRGGYSLVKKVRRKYRKYDYCLEKIEDEDDEDDEGRKRKT